MKSIVQCLLLLFIYPACTTIPSPEIQDPVGDLSPTGFKLAAGNITPGSLPLEISDNLRLVFSEPIDTKSLQGNAIRVLCNNETQPLPGAEKVSGSQIVFEFERRFYFDGNNNTVWSGLKPDSGCVVHVDARMKAVSGTVLSGSAQKISFSTVSNDMGIYWLAEDGSYEKSSPAIGRRFYDPAKPVVLFVHGWENTTTRNGFFRENPFVSSHKSYGTHNLLPLWKQNNYNIALFYWPQFADEPEVTDAERKVWTGISAQKKENREPMGPRFRQRNGEFGNPGKETNIAESLLQSYKTALKDYSGPEVRMIAHSLGSQLTIHFLKLLSGSIATGGVPKNLFPSRLALLDPFWSTGKRSYLGDRWTGEVCREYMLDLIARHKLPVEFVKSSLLGGLLVGDRNLELRSKVAYVRLRPKFIPLLDQKSAHIYSYIWYLNSISHVFGPPTMHFGARASPGDIKHRMSSQTIKPTTQWQIDGLNTADAKDDLFESQNGVDGG